MDLSTISSLMTGTLSDFGDQVLVVLTAVIGVAIAYFLFKFAWRKIKESVTDGEHRGFNRGFQMGRDIGRNTGFDR